MVGAERTTLWVAPTTLALLLLFTIASCGRADSAPADPLVREAEEAFVGYLRIDTTNPPGNETAGASYLRDLLARDGIEARLVGSDPRRQGVYARLASGSPEKALLLLSHIDVVPADPGAWRNPPFSGKREGGYIWGRGAIDCKSLTIAQAMALIDLKRRGAKLRRDVVFLAVPDEELGGLRGTKELLERHPELFEGVGYALNEGGANETAVDQILFWGIEVQQKVPLWLRVTAESGAGHGAMPVANGSAPARLVRALAAIDALETPYRLTEPVADAARRSLAARDDGRGKMLRLLREPLDIPRIEAELPAGYRALLEDTITITRLAGGTAVNVVPARASAEIDIRLIPGSTPDAMLARVKEAVGQNARVEVLLAAQPAPSSPSEGELFDSLVRSMRAAAPVPVAPIVSPGTTDSRFLRERGIVAYGIAPFKVNYYDADTIHADDERIRARFFAEGTVVMRSIVRDFCVANSSER